MKKLIAIVCLLAAPMQGYATNYSWCANGTNFGGAGLWTTNTTYLSWSNNTSHVFESWPTNAAGHVAIFPANGATVQVDTAGITVDTLQSSTDADYVIASNAFTLVNNATITNLTALKIYGVIHGTNGLIKSGTGNLTISNPTNDYTGTTWIRQGVIYIDGSNSLGVGTNEIVLGDFVGNKDASLNLNSNGLRMAKNIRARPGTGGDIAIVNGVNGTNGITILGDIILGETNVARNLEIRCALVNGNSHISGRILAEGTTTGSVSFTGVSGGGALHIGTFLENTNDYHGRTIINSAKSRLNFMSVKNVGEISSLGQPYTVANGTIDIGASANGRLTYIGTGDTSDRVINLSENSYSTNGLENNGSGPLVFTSSITATGKNAKVFSLGGTNLNTNTVCNIPNASNGGAISVVKMDAGQWVISGSNTFTGGMRVEGGTLTIAGSVKVGRTVLSDSATLQSDTTTPAVFRFDHSGGSPDNISVAAGTTLALTNVVLSFAPTAFTYNDNIWIVANSGGTITDTFAGYAEGATTNLGGRIYRMRYTADMATGAETGGDDVGLITTDRFTNLDMP